MSTTENSSTTRRRTLGQLASAGTMGAAAAGSAVAAAANHPAVEEEAAWLAEVERALARISAKVAELKQAVELQGGDVERLLSALKVGLPADGGRA